MSDGSIKREKRIIKIKKDLINALDENGNGVIDVEDLIIKCMKIPGVKVNREKFLRKEFENKLTNETIEKAIHENPMKANIKQEFIDRVVDNVIKLEKIQVSGISAVLSLPCGICTLATIPVDIVQYYAILLRTIQKLLYLYGYPELDLDYEGNILDSESMCMIITCLGIMFGVGTANKLIHKISAGLGTELGKRFIKSSPTKTTIWYNQVKSLFKLFDYKLNKNIVKVAIKNSLSVVGLVIGGTATFFSFGACCKNLKENLKNTIFSNNNYVEAVETVDKQEEDFIIEVPLDDNVSDKDDIDE